jgi:hypothetical protein
MSSTFTLRELDPGFRSVSGAVWKHFPVTFLPARSDTFISYPDCASKTTKPIMSGLEDVCHVSPDYFSRFCSLGELLVTQPGSVAVGALPLDVPPSPRCPDLLVPRHVRIQETVDISRSPYGDGLPRVRGHPQVAGEHGSG